MSSAGQCFPLRIRAEQAPVRQTTADSFGSRYPPNGRDSTDTRPRPNRAAYRLRQQQKTRRSGPLHTAMPPALTGSPLTEPAVVNPRRASRSTPECATPEARMDLDKPQTVYVPGKGLQFWDGEKLTDATPGAPHPASGSATASIPPTDPAPLGPARQKRGRRSRPLIATFAVAALALIGGTAWAAHPFDHPTTTDPTTNATSPPPAATAPPPSQAPPAPATTAPPPAAPAKPSRSATATPHPSSAVKTTTPPPPTRQTTPAPPKSPPSTTGYTTVDYAERLGDLPTWIGKFRAAEADGLTLTAHTDLVGLSHRFEEIGRLPSPAGIDPAYWSSSTHTLAQFAAMAADDWAYGDRIQATARFEVVVENSNTLIDRANHALGLHVTLS